MHIETKLVRFSAAPGDPLRPTSTPIYQTATFAQESAVECGPYDYTRSGNPTRTVLETQLAELEGARRAFTYGSGMAALTAVTRLVAAGDHILAGDDLYGGTYRLLSRLLPRQRIGVSYVDTRNLEAVQAAIQPNTRLVLVETPTNPRQRICDLRRLAEITHANGALLAVDNTLLSPYLQQPLARGADLVIHSATKSLSGHSDLTAGVLALNDSKLIEELYLIQNGEGGGLAPFDSWLLLRGIKTLAVRIDRQQSNAQQLAEYLLDHPAIQRVHYPGLRCHPGHELHLAQASGAGSLVSFETGSAEASQRILESLSLFTLTVSLGSVSSFASLPCRFSHASIPDRVRSDHGLPDDLVRLAVGIEKAEDLLQDLDQSLSLVNPIYSVPGVPRKRH